jgi:pyruvate kinase
MLESMIRSPRPTRAEASDVANAMIDGTDAVMLSGETASGRYPIEAVKTMARIVEVAEAASERVHTVAPETDQVLGRVVAKASAQIADEVEAVAILVFSLSGKSVQLVSKVRPKQSVIGLTTDERSKRRFSLMWGTAGQLVPMKDHSRDLIVAAEEICLEHGYGGRGDNVVIVSGIPGGVGGTNRVCWCTGSATPPNRTNPENGAERRGMIAAGRRLPASLRSWRRDRASRSARATDRGR